MTSLATTAGTHTTTPTWASASQQPPVPRSRRPPHDDVIITALDLIARLLSYDSTPPAIVPTSEGGVQLEWHRDGHELEIRVRANGEISAFRFDEAAGQGATVERISLSDLGPLVALTGRL